MIDTLRVPLISDKKEGYLLFGVAICLIAIHLLYLYRVYLSFIESPFILTKAKVVAIYSKKLDYVSRVKLNSSDIGVFYTQIYGYDLSRGDTIRVFVYPKKISFFEFLKGSSYYTKVASYTHKDTISSTLLEFIANQHKDNKIINFYQAIYLATPIKKSLRRDITSLGINHLTALSGFHLGILSGAIILLLSPIYSYFQARFFPYRSRFNDIGAIVLLLLLFYLYITSYPPSLVRAYGMMVVGYIVLVSGVELLDFTTLFVAILLILIIAPNMLLSTAFWLSVMGVVYIFILLKYIPSKHLIIKLVSISVGIFVLMSPIIHTIFPTTSFYQLLSPFISIAFLIFYPTSILLHLVGRGDIFDTILLKLFGLNIPTFEVYIPSYIAIFYIALSLVAIYNKRASILLFLSAVAIFLYIYIVALLESNLFI